MLTYKVGDILVFESINREDNISKRIVDKLRTVGKYEAVGNRAKIDLYNNEYYLSDGWLYTHANLIEVWRVKEDGVQYLMWKKTAKSSVPKTTQSKKKTDSTAKNKSFVELMAMDNDAPKFTEEVEEKDDRIYCPKCGKEAKQDLLTLYNCGWDFAYCETCGTFNIKTRKFY